MADTARLMPYFVLMLLPLILGLCVIALGGAVMGRRGLEVATQTTVNGAPAKLLTVVCFAFGATNVAVSLLIPFFAIIDFLDLSFSMNDPILFPAVVIPSVTVLFAMHYLALFAFAVLNRREQRKLIESFDWVLALLWFGIVVVICMRFVTSG